MSVSPLLAGMLHKNGIVVDENSWDYLTNLSESARTHIANCVASIEESAEILRADQRLTGEIAVNYLGILREINAATARWRANRESHSGRTGIPKDANEHAAIQACGSEYIQLVEEFLLNTRVAVSRFSELFQEYQVQLRLREQAEQAPVINTSV